MDYLKRSTLVSFAAFSLMAALPDGQSAAKAETPETVLLTVHGGALKQEFALSDLDALPQQSFITSTIWTTEPAEFSGPSLSAVMAASGQTAEVLTLRAVNRYSITMNTGALEENAPIVATRINGKTFGLRERGPLWVVYPYDANPRYRSEHTFAASIWQLTDILADQTP